MLILGSHRAGYMIGLDVTWKKRVEFDEGSDCLLSTKRKRMGQTGSGQVGEVPPPLRDRHSCV